MTADAAAPPEAARAHRHNPYVGPRSLCADDRIYGRSREIRELRASLVAHRIVLLYAVSGAGKTSLVEAGLRPELEEREFQVFPPIRVGYEPPSSGDETETNRYILSVMTSLEEARPPEEQMDPSDLAGMDLDDYISRLDAEAADEDPCLIFDQFEEVFTLDPTDWDAKQEFFVELGRVLANRGRWALFAMREDFIAQLDPYLALIPNHFETRYRMDLLGPDPAMQAITKPAAAESVEFTAEAAGKIIEDLRRIQVQRGAESVQVEGPNVEPVQLQVVCSRLWINLAPGASEVTPDDVAAAGTVNQALADFYDTEVKAAASPRGTGEREIRDWFEHKLITPDGFRTQVRKGPGRSGPAVIRSLQTSHLIRSDRIRGAEWYELSHDRFVEPIRESNSRFRGKRKNRWIIVAAVAVLFAAALLGMWLGSRGGDLPFAAIELEPVSFDAPLVGSIDEPGAIDGYGFEAEAGSEVLVTLRPLGELNPIVELRNSDGLYVGAAVGFPDQPGEPWILTAPLAAGGEYQVTVAGLRSSTGEYELHVSTADPTPVSLGVPNPGSIDETQSVEVHEFTSSSRVPVLVGVAAGEGLVASIIVFGPDSGVLAASGGGTPEQPAVIVLEAPADGTYLVSVNGFGGSVGTYTLTVEEAAVGDVSLDEPVSGVIAEPGDVAVYRYQIHGADNVMVDVAPSAGLDIRVRVTGPDDAPITLISDYGGEGDPEKPVIPTAGGGTYTVVVDGFEGTTGEYQLVMGEFEPVTIEVGASVRGAIVSPGDIGVFRADADEGEAMLILVTPVEELAAIVKVIDPVGIQVGGGAGSVGVSGASAVEVPIVAPTGGPYLIEVSGFDGSTGEYRLDLEAMTD